tara:strand:- start:1598 stop:1939 length:342 start_codon:yes stop_codon:yes gene_type:complete
MIDTDKYEGHRLGPWRTAEGQPYDDEGSHLDIVDANGVLVTETSYFTDIDFTHADYPNIQLLQDAPLLLQEVKRLREQIVDMIDSMDNHYIRDIQHATDCLRDMIGYHEDEEE